MQQIYLDNNATTAMLPEVAEAMARAYTAGYVNPASQHQSGQRSRRVLEQAREEIAQRLGAKTTGMDADRLIFTSGGTESNNLALLGLSGEPGSNIIVSAIEHPSVTAVADQLAGASHEVRRLPVDQTGVARAEALESLIDEKTTLVSVMLGNNETGVLQPLEAIRKRCAAGEVLLHTDAVQAVGKIPVAFHALGVSAMSFSAHKLHGPRGFGGLLLRHDVTPTPQMFGGFQQSGIRPGTESVALVLGLLEALKCWQAEATERLERMTSLRDRLESLLRNEVPDIVVNGTDSLRLPHTSNISFPGLDRQAMLMGLDMVGVACSTGSACASGSSDPSPVLLAMGLDNAIVESSIRLSLSALTTAADVDDAGLRIVRVCKGLRDQQSA